MSILLLLSWLLSTGLFGYSLLKISALGLVYYSSTLMTRLKINRNLFIGCVFLIIPCIIELMKFGTAENLLLTFRILGCFGLFGLLKSPKFRKLDITLVWWVIVLLILLNIYQHPPISNGKLGLQGFLGQLSPINPPQGFVGLFAALSFYVAGLKGEKIWCLFFIVVLIMSNSRAAILAVMLSLPLLVPFFFRLKKTYLMLLALVAFSLFYIFYNYQQELVFITAGRSIIYPTFIMAILENWLFGVGSIDNNSSVSLLFETTIVKEFDDGRGNAYTFGSDGFVAPHNDYLLILFRGGILSFIGVYFLTKKYLFDSLIEPNASKWVYAIFTFWIVFIFFENALTWPPLYVYLGILKREGSFVDKKT